MTIQQIIFKESKLPNKRRFSKEIRRSESYTANMLNAEKSVSIELAIDMMERLYFEKEVKTSIVYDYLKNEFGVY